MSHRALERSAFAWTLAAFLAVPAAWAVGQVSGKYMGNARAAKLTHAVVIPHEPWQDEAAYTIILSEKDPSKADKPDFDAMFGKLGDALSVSVTAKGDIFSTQVSHQELKKSGFSSVGSLYLEGFKIEGGQMSGRLFTKKQEEFFGDTWEVDLTFKAPLPAAKPGKK